MIQKPPPLDTKSWKLEERRESLTEFLSSGLDGTYYVGHACMLVRINGRKFIFDPVMQRPLLLDSWLYFPAQVMDARLLDVDGVLISHFHEDHYDPRFLRQLKPGTPVYVVEKRPMFVEWLASIGATVKTLPACELTEIADGVEVYAMPSEYNQIDSSFIVRGKRLCVYQGNDNFLTAKTLVAARDIVGPVDHAFVPYAYIWWYPFRLGNIDAATRDAEGQRLVTKYLDLGLEHAAILDAPVVVPCGGNLVYYDDVDSVINRAVYTPYDFVDYAHEHRPELAPRVMPLVAGDYVLKRGGQNEPHWVPSTTAEYTQRMASFLVETASKSEAPPPAPSALEGRLQFLSRRLERPEVTSLDYELVFQREDASKPGFRVDLLDKSIHLDTEVTPGRPWIRFEMQPVAFESWLAEEIIFEVVLESARFTVWREPERHDPKIWELLRLYF